MSSLLKRRGLLPSVRSEPCFLFLCRETDVKEDIRQRKMKEDMGTILQTEKLITFPKRKLCLINDRKGLRHMDR